MTRARACVVRRWNVLECVTIMTRMFCSTHAGLGESMYDQKPPNPKQIDTKGFLTDFGRNCRVK